MSIKRLFAISLIALCTSVAWFVLAGTIKLRSSSSDSRLSAEVVKNWGPLLKQEHPILFYEVPTSVRGRRELQPESSSVQIGLSYEPKRKGLLWYRTYVADFHAEYAVKNPTPIPQTLYVVFRFPEKEARYDQFSLVVGNKSSQRAPVEGQIRESILLDPGAEAPLKISYRASGMNAWIYAFQQARRVKNLRLTMRTNFREINIPTGAESPTSRRTEGDGWVLQWDYTDVLGANAIAMEMPSVANPGDVAGRMTFYAPVSLLFFFAVIVILSIRQRIALHPMNYFFLAAGCFAFQLLFAYLVDLLPLTLSFVIAASVSLLLVVGYLWRASGPQFARVAGVAQFTYMVLFSYSFFFQGLTGITITIGAIATLAILMTFTARYDWHGAFAAQADVSRP